MRLKSALVCLVLFAVVGGYLVSINSVQSQDADESTDSSSRQIESSLDFGDPFDAEAGIEFAASLTPEERTRLVRLKSRYALAETGRALPGNPGEVFYVAFREPLGRELADRIKEAGASFVGYAYPNTHFLRVRDKASIKGVKQVLDGAPEVAGILPRETMDVFSEDAWEMHGRGDWNSADFTLMFWRDVDADAKARALAESGAKILYAQREPDGRIGERVPFVEVTLTPSGLRALASDPDVEWIERRYDLVEHNAASTVLANAAPATVGQSTNYGLTGEGQVSVVFDGGIARYTHDDYQGATGTSAFSPYFSLGDRRVLAAPEIASNQSGWGLPDNSGVSSHATHVVGTVVGDGTADSSARGFATQGSVVSMGWGSMQFERQVLRHYFRHVADNHSYGQGGGGNGGYNSTAQASDIDIRDIWLNETKSAGNDGSGSNTCGDDTGRKNSFVIAATQDNGDIAGFSSRGPSDDGRLVPHFAANGVNLFSTWPTSDTAYDSISGTSMSAPSVNGSLLLLSELWKREMNGRQPPPDVMRGILAATADDRYNQGPDYRYGFGIIDVQRAADLILADSMSGGDHIVRGTIRQSDVVDYDLEVTSSSEPLKVICSWLDIHATTSASVTLVNDIDVELIDPSGTTVHYPWSGLSSGGLGDQTHQFTRTGPNNRDNIELVEVDSPATGTWTVRVTGTNIPADPQQAILNDATGFVLVSESAMSTSQQHFEDGLNATGPVAIPDGSSAGLARTFSVNSTDSVRNVRVYVDVRHEARGDIEIELEHPDGTSAIVETSDSNTRPDIIAVYPDTRQYDDDTAVFNGKPAGGTWQVHVRDLTGGNTGTLEYLALEIDYFNLPPIADAGGNQLVSEGDDVFLDGNSSSDPENDSLSFQWTQVSGPNVNLQGSATPTPSFKAPGVSVTSTVEFELIVDDGNLNQDSDVVAVTINKRPVADAGADFSVTEGHTVQLDGSLSSDPDGAPLTYAWVENGSSLVTLSGADTETPTFVAPQVNSRTFVSFRLTVDDGVGTHSDTVTVTVNEAATAGGGNGGGGGGCSTGDQPGWLLALLLTSLVGLFAARRVRSTRAPARSWLPSRRPRCHH